MNIKIIILSFAMSCLASLSLFAQYQSVAPIAEPDEVITFRFPDEQINFWLSAEDYITEQLEFGIDIYSSDSYKKATEQEREWLDSLDAGDSLYNTDYRSRYWGSNWSYASALIGAKNDSLVYDFSLLTHWCSPKLSNGVGQKITLFFEPAGNSEIKVVRFFPGNMRTPADWERYGRPAQVALRINDKDIAVLHLQDVMACQVFRIPMVALYEKNREITVTFEILSVYPGSEFEETVVSEINFDSTNIL